MNIELTESEIIWLFDQPSTVVLPGSEEAEAVAAQNAAYEAVLEDYRQNGDVLTERFAQTAILSEKHKECQVSAVETASVACGASEANIHDTYTALSASLTAATSTAIARGTNSDGAGVEGGAPTAIYNDPLHGADAKVGAVWTGRVDAAALAAAEPLDEKTATKRLEALQDVPGFVTALQVTERVVVHADSHCAYGQRLYKGIVPEAEVRARAAQAKHKSSDAGAAEVVVHQEGGATDADAVAVDTESNATQASAVTPQTSTLSVGGAAETGGGASVDAMSATNPPTEEATAVDVKSTVHFEHLWTYECSLTHGRAITATAWNKASPDILAAGYGAFQQSGLGMEGLVCCWSVKNPRWPEKHYTLPSGVCSVAFSTRWPSLLAVGCHNGTVTVLDVQTDGTEPVASSEGMVVESKHMAPVWALDFVVQVRCVMRIIALS